MNLGVAVMAGRYAVIRTGCLDLVVFQLAVGQPLILESGLEKSSPASAAVVVRLIGGHIYKILFTHDGLDHKTQIVGNGISITLAYDLTGILNRKLDLQILVPIGTGVEPALTDPLGVVFINIFDLELVLDVELFQSCQD